MSLEIPYACCALCDEKNVKETNVKIDRGL